MNEFLHRFFSWTPQHGYQTWADEREAKDQCLDAMRSNTADMVETIHWGSIREKVDFSNPDDLHLYQIPGDSPPPPNSTPNLTPQEEADRFNSRASVGKTVIYYTKPTSQGQYAICCSSVRLASLARVENDCAVVQISTSRKLIPISQIIIPFEIY